jgi:hypothetical protein
VHKLIQDHKVFGFMFKQVFFSLFAVFLKTVLCKSIYILCKSIYTTENCADFENRVMQIDLHSVQIDLHLGRMLIFVVFDLFLVLTHLLLHSFDIFFESQVRGLISL